MSLTCDRCLSGVHRCLTPTCACTCSSLRGGSTTPTAGGVARTPRPHRQRRPAATPGRPRLDPAEIPLAEFYASCGLGLSATAQRLGTTREKIRGALNAKALAAQEMAADPSGATWSLSTRRLYDAEVARLERAS